MNSKVINPYQWRDRESTRAFQKEQKIAHKITDSPNRINSELNKQFLKEKGA